MEDGSNGTSVEDLPPVENGVGLPIMANFPEVEEGEDEVNGDAEQVSDSYSSESDALVIDESGSKKKSSPIINPYFNESLFELSQQHQSDDKLQFNLCNNKRLKKNSPKLREYAQYLGLQPTVQFKCSKCGRAGFESLTTLNEHIVQCTDEPLQSQSPDPSSSSFKLTRKVFLCSACGTYYENWNLYLHMIEVHRRYLCLYCLGMFSVLDDLCLHIQSKHNLEPGYKNTLEDFFSVYADPCYIVCCECNKIFSEQDNFFYHTCAKNKNKVNNQKVAIKQQKVNKTQIRPEDHITGDSTQVKEATVRPEDDNSVTVETSAFDSGIEKPVEEKEIVYSSDEELNFRGFTETGEPVFVDKLEQVEDQPAEEVMEVEEIMEVEEEPVETRKVPKLSLKLKPGSFPEIEQQHSDEEALTEYNIVPEAEAEAEAEAQPEETQEQIESENELVNGKASPVQEEILIAGPEINIIELELEQPLDKFDIRVLLQKCLNATASYCIYCNHARKIAVNGKQLGLHAIAEHRFSGVVHSITAEELIPESFVARIKESLATLEEVFFSLESSPSDEGVTFSHVFECFQCRYSTGVHKELYLHNRKLHAKNLLLCIMCKSNFYSYSELICHLCPGVYILDSDVQFRCCMCVGDDLPSAFRLMVHLRKRHHVCDVCLEMCHNQYRLSNHVWKHKLHHFCYRCGIAYRNKPDITRHLFWKHGTESVLCKKCLQKKWPHVYHFCVPPTTFLCDECNLTFSKAVTLKVHKRIHTDEKPHSCTVDGCQEKFISKKLLAKHEQAHREPPPEEKKEEVEEPEVAEKKEEEENAASAEKVEEKIVKPKVDVYDLPELNLSESDSSDSEAEAAVEKNEENADVLVDSENIEMQGEIPADSILEETIIEEITTPAPVEKETTVIENIWDNFKTYQANKVKFDSMLTDLDKTEPQTEIQEARVEDQVLTVDVALRDHDYCIDPDSKPDVSFTEVKPDLSQSVDHDYCFAKKENPKPDPPKKKVSSDSSSDSDSSSCSCGPNCSCSSSSGSSSSSSDSSDSDSSTEEGRRRQQLRRERRRQKKNNEEPKVEVVACDNAKDTPIQESDLETTESETDEEFYDKQPQKLAKKILEEKRNQILAGIDQANGVLETSRAATPNLPEVEETKPKKKSKSKKKKKKKSERKVKEYMERNDIPAPYYQYSQPPTVAPITLTLTRNSPVPVPGNSVEFQEDDGSLRASKRRRVPNKFYGYSSDEEGEKMPKWRKAEVAPPQHSSMVVPPITIKTPTPQPSRIIPKPIRKMPPIKLKPPKLEEVDSEVESNDSSNEGRNMLQVDPNALYCYCKCPYDEVSEMIGCDSRDCAIEWFHFECVGIMVPPKGHWYCPECRKKRQQKREMLKLKAKSNTT